jgi:neurexin
VKLTPAVLLVESSKLKNVFQDYFAIEMLDGHLHVHLDLGSGAIKIRASRVQLHDGNWHRVELTLRKNQGRITIDGDTEAFETPGK